ncbi:restriction endonuclease subunit S [Marinomonas shanghaiensis]|uniref:restriction endonuclease subunit S n=1 Tax=Marinomonas shanghaiensis TaxID=2202418 RepID=UPI0018E593EA|nr:restriction endonuclease subunit S [Marinomonas shanghaiensis]
MITEHIDIWSSAIKRKSSSGRGSSKKIELYGIKKLRELILELAVRGKLVAQDPNDEPASVLLERIVQEKDQLVKEGKIKKPKKLPEISEDEKPFELPEGWEWARLGELGYTQTGGTPSKNKTEYFGSDIPFIKPGDILEGKVNYSNEGLSYFGAESLGRIAPKGSVLMVCIGTIGKCAYIDQKCAFNQQINSITPYLDISEFLFKVLSASYFQNLSWSFSASTTIAIINKGKWEMIPVVLPPLTEQHRIVAKVDELTALCDQLEAQTESSLDAHQALVTVLLDTLVNSQNAEELAENWMRISGHFDTLFTTEHSIDQLKQTILQLAVMGKLVPQDPNDEPASELLKRIAAEKDELIKQKKIKKQKPLPPISEDEKPFDLPVGWRVSSVDSCFYVSGGIQKTPKRTPVSNHYPYLAVANVQRGNIDINDLKRFEVTGEELDQYRLESFDLLVVEGNGSENEIGRCAIWKGEIENCLHQNHLIKCRPAIHKLSDWVLMVLNSPLGISEMKRLAVTSSGLYNLSVGKVRTILLPIPPLEEQHRIVAKVDELMAICDQLKARLSEAQTTQLNLAEALVEQAL